MKKKHPYCLDCNTHTHMYGGNPAEQGNICKFGVMPSREPFSLFL